MLLMKDDKKPSLGAIIVARMGKPKGMEGSEDGEEKEPSSRDAILAGSRALIQAIESKDEEAVADAFIQLQELCDDDSEYEEKEPEEDADKPKSEFM